MFKNRISSKSGATLLIALLFFLLCAMAGVVVLTAGTAASGRIAGIKQQQQAYYSVTSAAKLIQEQIEGQGFTYAVEESNGFSKSQYPQHPDGDLKGLLSKASESIYADNQNGRETTYTDTLSIHPANKDDEKMLGEVTGEFTMQSDYSIEIVLHMSSNDDKNDCVLTLRAKALKQEYESTGENVVTQQKTEVNVIRHETQVIWSECVIDKT